MPYYTKDDNEVDDFKDYDPTPYSGGYDISVTYGRSLPPSDRTCYPLSSRSGDAFEYKRPVFSSSHQSSACEDQTLKTEYSSYARPEGHSGGAHVAGEYGGSGHDGRKVIDDYEKGSHKEHSGKDSYDEKKEKKKDKKKDSNNSGDDEKKKDKKKDGKNSGEDEKKDHHDGDYDEKKKKNKDHKDGDNDEKKKKDHKDGDYDEKKKKKDHKDGDYDEKKKKKDHKDGDYDDKKKKDHYKSNKDNYGSDDEKKKKKKDNYKHHD